MKSDEVTRMTSNGPQITADQCRFWINPQDTDYLSLLDDNTLKYKGRLMSVWRNARIGTVFQGIDKVIIYLDVGSVGSGSNFFIRFSTIWYSMTGIKIYGNDTVNGFGDVDGYLMGHINSKSRIQRQLKSMTLFKSGTDNVIAIKVDMRKQKGFVWNKNDPQNCVEINLYEAVVIGISLCGSENKTISIKNVIIE